MSPGQILERVYDALKGQITKAAIPPGSRLDPVKLAHELAASATPVRDALHRLVGERIVEAWPQEGFHAALQTEAGLRDLYDWQSHLLGLILRTIHARAAFPPQPGASDLMAGDAPDEGIASLFLSIAARAANREVRHALVSAVERLASARIAERSLLDAQQAEYSALVTLWQSADNASLRLSLARYHRRRIRAVAAILAAMPSRNRPEFD